MHMDNEAREVVERLIKALAPITYKFNQVFGDDQDDVDTMRPKRTLNVAQAREAYISIRIALDALKATGSAPPSDGAPPAV